MKVIEVREERQWLRPKDCRVYPWFNNYDDMPEYIAARFNEFFSREIDERRRRIACRGSVAKKKRVALVAQMKVRNVVELARSDDS
jgi:hypothetical protein